MKKSVVTRVINTPPVKWNGMISRRSSADLQELSRELDAISERAARLSAYLSSRGAAGCGDGGHDLGVKNQNRVGTRVRKALGFSYPARGNLTF